MALTINLERLNATREVLQRHSRSVFIVIGTTASSGDFVFPENQRSVALLLHLFPKLTEALPDVALLIDGKAVGSGGGGPSCTIITAKPERFAAASPENPIQVVTADSAASVFSSAGSAAHPLVVLKRESDLQRGAFAESVRQALGATLSASSIVDEPHVVSECLLIKDKGAVDMIKKAGALCGAVLTKLTVERFTKELAKHADAESRDAALAVSISDAEYAQAISEHIRNPKKLPGLESMNDPAFSEGLPAFVRSGGAYDPSYVTRQTPSATTPHVPGTTVISYGVRYSGYVTYLARTLIYEPVVTPLVLAAYDFIFQVQEALLANLVPGRSLKDVFEATLARAKSLNAQLADQILPDFGFGLGLHYYDAKSTINTKNEATLVREGMLFAVRCGIPDLRDPDTGASSGFAVLLGDTVIINATGPELITKRLRTGGEIRFKAVARSEPAIPAAPRDLTKITRAANADPTTQKGKKGGLTEDQRQVLLQQVLQYKQEQWAASGGQRVSEAESEEMRVSELGLLAKGEVAPFNDGGATAPDKLPEATANAILAAGALVNREKEVLYAAVAGKVVGFSIATISKAEVRAAGASTHQLVITFHSSQESNVAFRANRNKVFVREIIITSNDGAKLSKAANDVRDVLAIIKQKDTQRKATQGIVQQPKLIMAPSSEVIALPDVKCRPPPISAKDGCVGRLEVHRNGFRFNYRGGEPVEIIAGNVKHMIYQPAQNDLCTILHFALKAPMMVGKKKVDHVQFVVDVVDSSEKLTSRKMTHEEEMELEDQDEERIASTNKQFARFCHSVKGALNLFAETPFGNFEITGVTKNSINKIRGSEKCIWSIIELPFFVQSLEEVELVALERVLPGQKNFDATFVINDVKTTRSITTIPMEKIDELKDYLLQCTKTPYFESTMNIAWPTLLKPVREDKDFEPWGAEGWTVIIGGDDDEDEEGEGTDDDDSTYEESEDSDEDDDDDDSDSDWAEEVDSDEDDDDDDSDASSDDDDDSSALSWDEAERRAEAEDRKKSSREDWSDDDDEDSDRPKKKKARTESGRQAAPPARPAAAPPAKAMPTKFAPGVPASGMKMPPPQGAVRPGAPIQRPAPGVLPTRR